MGEINRYIRKELTYVVGTSTFEINPKTAASHPQHLHRLLSNKSHDLTYLRSLLLDIRTTVFDGPFTRKGKMLKTTLLQMDYIRHDAPAARAPHTIKKVEHG